MSPSRQSPRHPVADLLFARLRSGSRPGRRADGHKLGLAVEGGGMRGVVSAGMLSGLEQLGLLNAFDAVYGTSAGAINGAYFIAGQTAYGTTIYFENINNSRFFSYARLLLGRPALSLRYLLRHVMMKEKILDWRAVLDSPIPLKAVALRLGDLEPALLSGFESRDELVRALRASASIPILAGPPAVIDGRRYIDGGIFEPTSFVCAVADGCTHLLVCPTLPAGRREFKNSFLYEILLRRSLNRIQPRLGKFYARRSERYLADYERLDRATRNPTAPPYLLAVRLPPGAAEIYTFEKRRGHLVAGAAAGMEAMIDELIARRPFRRKGGTGGDQSRSSPRQRPISRAVKRVSESSGTTLRR